MASTVVTGPNNPNAAPPSGGPRRIAVRDPTPVYPHSLIWRNDNPHPALATLRDYLAATRSRQRDNGTWAPGWE